MDVKRITATEAARNFSEVLNQVAHRGESFVIVRNGEEVGQLTPMKRTATLRQLLEGLSWPVDDKFADDLESIQADQTISDDPWPS